MNNEMALWLALGSAVLAVVYGLLTTRWVLSKPAGNEKMQQIAAAVQEGAKAYMNRQYSTIAVVGVILNLSLWFALHVLAPGIAEDWIGPLRWWALPETGFDIVAVALAAIAAARHAGVAPTVAIAALGSFTGVLHVVSLGGSTQLVRNYCLSTANSSWVAAVMTSSVSRKTPNSTVMRDPPGPRRGLHPA